jgi:signal transduction histidine kinase
MTFHPPAADVTLDPATTAAARGLLREHQEVIWGRTDRLFAGLLAAEWLAGVALAYVRSPRDWAGATSSVHAHLWAAVLLGAAIAVWPIYLAFAAPTQTLTRHVIAAAQMMMSALLIHVGDGRIEMHFHIFGSLAFLAFYRDWRVLITASAVVAVDHLVRGVLFPESVYGVSGVAVWRTVEHAGWVVFEDIFLITSCMQGVREMRGIAENQALLQASHRSVEEKVRERTRQLEAAQEELVKSARTAGMAEIATSVLHNVGNVLNSVNIAAGVIAETVSRSEVASLARVSEMVRERKSDLGRYLTTDPAGQMIPDFLSDLAVCLQEEQRTITGEIGTLSRGVEHIKQIVAAQQGMAKRRTARVAVRPADLMESALVMQGAALGSGTRVEREYGELPEVLVDQHRVLQVLINLIGNARQAIGDRGHGGGAITLTCELAEVGAEEGERLRLSVTDDGIGIAPENLERIFSHGFTTKKTGHGFGLHGAANAAAEMGGRLTASSRGRGRGSTFVLEIPVVTAAEASTCSN